MVWQEVKTASDACNDNAGWYSNAPDLFVEGTVGSTVLETTKESTSSYTESVNELLSFGCQSTSATLTLTLVDYDDASYNDECMEGTVADWV